MSDASTVIEGVIKYRDGKKWKPRWCIVRKLSPVADCLHLQLYRDVKDKAKLGPTKASLSLENFLGSESGFTLDKESNTLAIICKEIVVVLAFETREGLIEWQVKINTNLGEGRQFLVDIGHIPAKSRLSTGSARVHVIDGSFCLTSGLPPRLLGNWQFDELRRYGVVSGKFCFEGGSRCGRGEGLHVLLSNQPQQIATVFDLASQGKLLANRRPFIRKDSLVSNGESKSTTRQEHWTSTTTMTTCSTESSQPLLNSSDSSSNCDGSIESCRPIPVPLQLPLCRPTSSGGFVGPATCNSDEHKENYRWPSHGSNDGKTSVASIDLDNEIPGGGVGRMTPNWTAGNLGDGYGTDKIVFHGMCSMCNGCVANHSTETTESVVGMDLTTSNDNTMLSPTWNGDGKRRAAAATVQRRYGRSVDGVHWNGSGGSSRQDRDAVSVSSHGSTSSGESNASEYSTPKHLAESLYDKPRNILPHVCCHVSGTKGCCTATPHMQNLQHVQMHPQQSTIDRLAVNSLVKHCTLLPHVHHTNNGSSAGTSAVQSRCPSPLASPRWGPPQQNNSTVTSNTPRPLSPLRMNDSSNQTSPSRKHAVVVKGNLTVPSPSVCRTFQTDTQSGRIDPYGNYDVPRPVLCHHAQKLDQAIVRRLTPQDSGCVHSKNRTSIVSSDGSDYDVPRRIKECLKREGCNHGLVTEQSVAVPGSSAGHSCGSHQIPNSKSPQQWCIYPMELNGGSGGCELLPSKFIPDTGAQQVCACQRVMHWAENLLVCKRPTGTDTDLEYLTVNIPTKGTEGCNIQQQTAVACSSDDRSSGSQPRVECGTTMHHYLEAKIGPDGSSVVQIVRHCRCTQVLCNPSANVIGASEPSLDDSSVTFPVKHEKQCNTSETKRTIEDSECTVSSSGCLVTAEQSKDSIPPSVALGASYSQAEIGLCSSSNYANLNFVQSLSLYENAGTLLANLQDQDDKCDVKTVVDDTVCASGNEILDEAKETTKVLEAPCCSHCGHSFVQNQPLVVLNSSNDISNYMELTPRLQPNLKPPKAKTIDLDASNYLMMQPCGIVSSLVPSSESKEMQPHYDVLPQECTDSVVCNSELPLRPFMPLHILKTSDLFREKVCTETNLVDGKSNMLLRNCLTLPSRNMNLNGHRTVRSNSVVEMKKRVFLRKRSNSADSQSNKPKVLSKINLTGNSSEKILSEELALNSKDSWPSAEDIAKAIDLNISCHSLENQDSNYASMSPPSIFKDHIENNRNCSVDLPDDENSRTSVVKSVKRSSSVPCKSGNRDSASSSDSGVSTGSPKQVSTVLNRSDNTYTESELNKIHGTTCGTPKGNNVPCLHQQESMMGQVIENIPCGDTCIWLQRTNGKGDHSSSQLQGQVLVQLCSGDSKSTTSSTMSDMSDYIETLSLSSHGSGDSQDLYHCHGSATNTLRPRSSKEYQKVDRNTLADMSPTMILMSTNNGANVNCIHSNYDCGVSATTTTNGGGGSEHSSPLKLRRCQTQTGCNLATPINGVGNMGQNAMSSPVRLTFQEKSCQDKAHLK